MSRDDSNNTELQQLCKSGFALALRLLHHREDAADAVQDSLYQALRHRSSYDRRKGTRKAWFLKMVRNRCIDLRRKRVRQKEPPAPDWLENSPAADRRPDEHAQQRELSEIVRRHLMAMPDKHREIVLLRDYHNLSYAEIAEVLSIPSGTVMSRLHRAREELRRRVYEQHPEGEP